ncbi:hypothetical protein LCGC14_1739370 [marine sediment metagenome]|uniref:Uncharacterized protein n=1 Tax=marine sediment metagenome TaxID=412755 RepID=A0A0F9K6V1_9ZZZZ
MKLLVQLEVELEVEEEILEDNNEPMTDKEIANSISVSIPSGSWLSCMEEAIEINDSRVLEFSRILSKTS